MQRDIYFGNWHLCPDTLTLSDGSSSCRLEPRVAQLLEYFLDHPDEVLSHEQLMKAVWSGRVVSDDAVRRAVSSLRHALPADVAQQWVTTIPKKGYLAHFPTALDTSPRPAEPTPNPIDPGLAVPQKQLGGRVSAGWLLALVVLVFLALLPWAAG